MYKTNQNSQFQVYLQKLNYNLDDDTLYTLPFTYDSLCPYQIASDTILQDDCRIIVRIEEEKENGGQGEEGKKGGMEIWPNPARDQIHVRLNMDNLPAHWWDGRYYKDLTLVIYDIFGRQAIAHALPQPGEGGSWIVNVSSLPPGIYIAILKNGFTILESRKFVIVR